MESISTFASKRSEVENDPLNVRNSWVSYAVGLNPVWDNSSIFVPPQRMKNGSRNSD